MISWTERKVSVEELRPFERNPRKIDAEGLERLKSQIARQGYHQRILATRDLRIIGGHQRIKVLKQLGIEEIAVLIPDRDLTDKQFREIVITDNLHSGEFDIAVLIEDYELDDLKDLGMPADLLREFKKSENTLTDAEDVPLNAQHRPDVEYIIYFRKNAVWNNSVDGVNYSKCLEYSRDSSTPHPTMKPVEMIENELRISSNEGSIVVDFYAGSGSTLIACERTGRQCYTAEIQPLYCDVVIRRWQNFTGKRAIHAITGEEFGE